MIGDFNPTDFEWDDVVGWKLKRPLHAYFDLEPDDPRRDCPWKRQLDSQDCLCLKKDRPDVFTQKAANPAE